MELSNWDRATYNKVQLGILCADLHFKLPHADDLLTSALIRAERDHARGKPLPIHEQTIHSAGWEAWWNANGQAIAYAKILKGHRGQQAEELLSTCQDASFRAIWKWRQGGGASYLPLK